MLEPVDVVLPTGDYALIFGSDGLFGANGFGIMPDVNAPLPGATFFAFASSIDAEWIEVVSSLRCRR